MKIIRNLIHQHEDNNTMMTEDLISMAKSMKGYQENYQHRN